MNQAQTAAGKVLAGRTAVVTGGSRGLGRAIVRRLADDGAAVVFSYATNKEAATEIEEEIAAAGGTAWAVQTELAEVAQIERLFTTADEHFRSIGAEGLDILVNSAGVASFTPIGETAEAEYDRVMAVNAKAPYFAVQFASQRMGDGGRIIGLSTVTTRWPRVPESVYIASKSAGEAFVRVAARELGPRGITVNTVSPGPSDTDMLRGATTAEIREHVIADTPLGRLGRPADVAAVVAFLAGPDAAWVTGQNIRADGGLVY
ncbi:SDR family oxidoreductase [Streptomyces sp. NPDC092369]|uniref:SDR family oxidoreductase n=1 Tax=Streptomyces sp. NPDC092369 TaxID=3366015 RepID=UPI000F4F6A31